MNEVVAMLLVGGGGLTVFLGGFWLGLKEGSKLTTRERDTALARAGQAELVAQEWKAKYNRLITAIDQARAGGPLRNRAMTASTEATTIGSVTRWDNDPS